MRLRSSFRVVWLASLYHRSNRVNKSRGKNHISGLKTDLDWSHCQWLGKSKSAPLSPHNLELLYDINKRDMELYYYILELHHRRVRVCLRTNGDAPGKNHGEAGDVPAWATHDVDAILA